MKNVLLSYVKSGHPGIYLVSPEETRVEAEMLAVAKERLNAPAQAAPLTAEEIAGGAPRVETTV